MTDPQERTKPGEWISHDGPMRIANMSDEYLVNCFKTCKRHDNPKAEHLLSHIIDRGLQYRVKDKT